MSETKEDDGKAKTTLSLGRGGRGKMGLKGGDATVRQSFSHGRSKAVQVEHKRKRGVERGEAEGPGRRLGPLKGRAGGAPRLTERERETRERVLRALRQDSATTGSTLPPPPPPRRAPPPAAVEEVEAKAPQPEAASEAPAPVEERRGRVRMDRAALREREMAERKAIEEERKRKSDDERKRLDVAEKARRDEERRRSEEDTAKRRQLGDRAAAAAMAKVGAMGIEEEPAATTPTTDRRGKGRGRAAERPGPQRAQRGAERRRGAKLTVSQALTDRDERTRSLSSVRRQRERARAAEQALAAAEKISREVTVPEVITVQELANRMAERGADVIKALFKMGVMATINQSIDTDTAELVASELGHTVKRVSEADVELGLGGSEDTDEDRQARPPVVTVMGHVDHGKTSLLDALRRTDVVTREAGGITQHIGAYQVTLDRGDKVTFIDTPGHAAFSAMRARGATTTDIVVLVVAADDGVMPQTIEAINHAKAARAPIIVAINKMDLAAAKPERIRNDLLQQDVIVEEVGGETQSIEISALKGEGLEKLLDAILLQAEIMELNANPDRSASGTVVEAKMERGRGAVATVLVQRGTLRIGDIFVTGEQWGRVRALIDDHGETIAQAPPAFPVEVLGLSGPPLAGDDFVVVENEARAREVAAYRERQRKEQQQVTGTRGTLEQMFAAAKKGQVKELPVIIKGDVQGSVEAIGASLTRLTEDNEEVQVRVLHAGVGAINESDTTLAHSTGAMIIGFNVRANPQAREIARRDNVEIRYYAIIYNVIDDIRNALSGMLAPSVRESFIGNAEIREVFNITRVGKVAGCYITDGVVRRGAGVRLLRDNVVIHEGKLKTLKRFKDEVREVTQGYECGMAFENYDDIRQGDFIECFELVEEVRAL